MLSYLHCEEYVSFKKSEFELTPETLKIQDLTMTYTSKNHDTKT